MFSPEEWSSLTVSQLFQKICLVLCTNESLKAHFEAIFKDVLKEPAPSESATVPAAPSESVTVPTAPVVKEVKTQEHAVSDEESSLPSSFHVKSILQSLSSAYNASTVKQEVPPPAVTVPRSTNPFDQNYVSSEEESESSYDYEEEIIEEEEEEEESTNPFDVELKKQQAKNEAMVFQPKAVEVTSTPASPLLVSSSDESYFISQVSEDDHDIDDVDLGLVFSEEPPLSSSEKQSPTGSEIMVEHDSPFNVSTTSESSVLAPPETPNNDIMLSPQELESIPIDLDDIQMAESETPLEPTPIELNSARDQPLPQPSSYSALIHPRPQAVSENSTDSLQEDEDDDEEAVESLNASSSLQNSLSANKIKSLRFTRGMKLVHSSSDSDSDQEDSHRSPVLRRATSPLSMAQQTKMGFEMKFSKKDNAFKKNTFLSSEKKPLDEKTRIAVDSISLLEQERENYRESQRDGFIQPVTRIKQSFMESEEESEEEDNEPISTLPVFFCLFFE